MELMYPAATALSLIAAMSIAGIAHVVWLKSSYSKRWSTPVDFGATWRRRRLFGDNKQLRGFMVLPIAAAAAFALLKSTDAFRIPWLAQGLWPISVTQYACLGFACGTAFLLFELPNSFIKRQLGIAPGHSAPAGAQRLITTVIDRVDSTIGVLLVISFCLPVTLSLWFWTLLVGVVVHLIFSLILHQIGVKRRAW